MIFIDWISPKAHAAINRNLLDALHVRNAKLYVFDRALENVSQDTVLMTGSKGRLARAVQVATLCWHHRREAIFLLSYDPILIPILQLYCRRLYAYEHNTTPEGEAYTKHSLWQRLLFYRIVRFAQFPGQHAVLEKLGQKSTYLGSPLSVQLADAPRRSPHLFLAPSNRINANELARIAPFLSGAEVVVRRTHFSDAQLEVMRKEVNMRPVEWIDLDTLLPQTRAIILTVASRIRGSGWVHEAFLFGVPLVITHPDMCALFEETYPSYPYVRLDAVNSAEEFEAALARADVMDRPTYAASHNTAIRARFEAARTGDA